jgi:hypothetical protein
MNQENHMKQSSADSGRWNPAEKPWRVAWTFNVAAPAYWLTRTAMYRTEAEVEAAAQERAADKHNHTVKIDRVRDPENFMASGSKWTPVRTVKARKRKPSLPSSDTRR